MNIVENKTILVVDDEPHVVTYLETLLQDNGFTTVSASNNRDARDKVKNNMPQLVCLDITMPEESGLRFYRELKDDPDLRSIPVVIVTAVTGYGGDPDGLKEFLDNRRHVPSPEGFFSKPINAAKFVAKIKDLLAKA
jgi:CheY-like chemotaxis protein